MGAELKAFAVAIEVPLYIIEDVKIMYPLMGQEERLVFIQKALETLAADRKIMKKAVKKVVEGAK